MNLLVAEPVRDGSTGLEALAELSARDVESLDTLRDLIHWLVFIRRGKVRHLLEGHHLDLQLVAVLGDQVLSIVRSIEILACRVLARASVVTANDEVRHTKVLADDRVPDGLTRSSHAHGEWEEGELTHTVRVLGHDGLVDADTGIMIDIAWLGESDDGVDEDVGLALTGSADGQLAVSTVHRVAGLEGDDLAPCEFLEVRAELSGCVCCR